MAVSAAVLLAGCQGKECTDVGCDSGAVVEFSLVQSPRGFSELTVCVDQHCETMRPTEGAVALATSGRVRVPETTERTVTVSYRLVRNDGKTFNGSTRARMVRSQPNGSGCGPVCYNASTRVASADGALEEVAH